MARPIRTAMALFIAFVAHAALAQESFTDLLSRPQPAAGTTIPYGPEPGQFGTLWLPKALGPHPVAVLIHGGCWRAQLPGIELMDYLAGDLRARGFAVWNLEYRRLGKTGAGYPGTFLDVANGMDMLRPLAAKYALDLHRIVVIGHSAGGHLALWAAARNRIAKTSLLYRQNPLPVRAVVTLSGIDDLKAFHDDGPGVCGEPETIDRLIGARVRGGIDAYADTSPAALLPLGVKQIVVSGALDDIVPARFGRDYAARAKAAGDDVRFLPLPNAGHFELIDPRSNAWSQVAPLIQAAVQ